jgi:hypothetical protein
MSSISQSDNEPAAVAPATIHEQTVDSESPAQPQEVLEGQIELDDGGSDRDAQISVWVPAMRRCAIAKILD